MPDTDRALVIYPRSSKYELAFEQPYLERRARDPDDDARAGVEADRLAGIPRCRALVTGRGLGNGGHPGCEHRTWPPSLGRRCRSLRAPGGIVMYGPTRVAVVGRQRLLAETAKAEPDSIPAWGLSACIGRRLAMARALWRVLVCRRTANAYPSQVHRSCWASSEQPVGVI